MAALKEFLKTTIIGGLVFLVPVILIVVILGHAMRLAAKIAGIGSAKALRAADLTPVPEV